MKIRALRWNGEDHRLSARAPHAYFLLLDNEGDTDRLEENLLEKVSIHYPGRRITRRNWIKIWSHSFEFDNYYLT